MRLCLTLVIALLAAPACDRAPAPDQPPAAPAADEPRVYTWYDASGRPHLADSLEAIPESARGKVVVSSLNAGAGAAFADTATVADFSGDAPTFSKVDLTKLAGPIQLDGAALLEHREVFVYSTPWCGFCKKAMAYLASKKVPYVEKDIEASAKWAAELAAKNAAAGITSGGVPIIDVAGTLIVGFDRPRLDAALEKAGLGATPDEKE